MSLSIRDEDFIWNNTPLKWEDKDYLDPKKSWDAQGSHDEWNDQDGTSWWVTPSTGGANLVLNPKIEQKITAIIRENPPENTTLH